MKLIQYPRTQAEPIPGMLPPVTVREFRGVSTYDPFSIPDSFFTEISSLTSDDFPALSVRPGYTVLGNAGTKVLGMGAWKDTQLHVIFNDGTWQRWDGSTWATLTTGLNTSADWTFTNFQGNLSDFNLIASNGVDPIKRFDGSTVQNLTGAPAGGNFICTYQNRLWCAVGKELHGSELDNPESWSDFSGEGDDSFGKDMENNKGGDINMLTPSLTKLTIGLEPGVLWEMYGALPSDFNFRSVTDDEGPVNNKSVATQEGIMRFIHKTGIYNYSGGTLPSKSFSDIVSGLQSGVDVSSVAGSDGTKLYFKIGSSILVYDPRPGVDAWTVWNDIPATQFIIFQNQLYIGDALGRVLKLGGLSDAGSAINWHAITKPFNNSAMSQRQRWYKLFVVAELAAGSALNVSLSPSVSGNDWTLVSSMTGTGAKVQRALIPVSQFALENWIRVKIEGSGWVRLHEITRQSRQLPLY